MGAIRFAWSDGLAHSESEGPKLKVEPLAMIGTWAWQCDHLAPDGTLSHLAAGQADTQERARRRCEEAYYALTRATKREAMNGTIRRVPI